MKNSVAAAIIVFSVFATGTQVAAQPMYGSTNNRVSPSGSVGIVDQTTGAFTLIGDPTPGNDVLPGIDFNSLGQLFGVDNPPGNSAPSVLIRIDPVSGGLLGTIGTVTDSVTTTPIRIVDLAFQPGTDVLFGISSAGILYRISTTTAVATEVGDPGLGNGGIAFAPNGTLYLATSGNRLATLDPTTGAPLTNIAIAGGAGYDGLAVRPTDGLLFATETDDNGVDTIDPTTGQATNIGPADGGPDTADLAFFVPAAATATAPVLSPWGLVDLAGLLLGCGAFLQRSRVFR